MLQQDLGAQCLTVLLISPETTGFVTFYWRVHFLPNKEIPTSESSQAGAKPRLAIRRLDMQSNAGESIQYATASARSVETPSWKAEYEKTIWESDTEKLLSCVYATEAALFLRWQELGDDSVAKEEGAAMNVAAADLLAIKIHKLGWPGFTP